ncbi:MULTISPECIES: hypothetical protein [unclassified Arthrobacter]|uniref:hypothetical protein n=1 Tax=unclassified Arthrobacter TaxID=235627 RepID=UPI00055750A3|nr:MULTISPECIES: hypothetical protein [unclassified Arthrobacter]PVE19587.1 hypothetical protein DDA93_02195 [Arthrobacter sp. Bz4]
MNYPLQYRRARALVYAVLLFWVWAWLGSSFFIASLFGSPVHALLAMYALSVAVLVSIPALLLAVARMLLTRTRAQTGNRVSPVVTDLSARRSSEPAPTHEPDWWFSDKAS